MPENEDILLSQTQLAARLGVSERTVQRLVRRGVIPYERIGNTPVFYWARVQDALAKQPVTVASHPDYGTGPS